MHNNYCCSMGGYKFKEKDGGSMKQFLKTVFKRYTIIPIFITLFITFSLLTDKFLTFANMRDVILQSSIMGVMAVGATFLMINGYRDLSAGYRDWETDRKSTRLNSSHSAKSRMPSSA